MLKKRSMDVNSSSLGLLCFYGLKSVQGDRFVLCTACNFHINVSHGEKNDLTKYSETKAHKANSDKSMSTPKLTQVFAAHSSAPAP